MNRVLVVEDDARQRNMICLILSNAGYGVVEAVSVKTALMHLDIIDLSAIVLDLRLPNGHGRRVVEELVAKRDDVPVVVLTGYPEDAPKGWPVSEILDKTPPPELSDDGKTFVERPTFRTRLLQAVAKAREAADAIKSMRSTTRRLGDKLTGN